MKFAIHHSTNYQFSKRWIDYCEANNITYKIVDAYDTNIINNLKDCDVFLWQFTQARYEDKLMAKQLLYSIEASGVKVFPDFKSSWHFDDKIAQKYLLESLDVPFIKSYVFYTKKSSIKWLEQTTFPKVFKLRGGASSMNVFLVNNFKEAKKIVNKAFSRGFSSYNWKFRFLEAVRKFRKQQGSFKAILGLILYSWKRYPNDHAKFMGNEKGYVYFQDFIPKNNYDIRIIIVNNKSFAVKRLNRENDFRASGSGNIIYDKSQIDERCVELAFNVNKKLMAQCVAFDFIFDEHLNPLIVEISYAFSPSAYDKCEGYWDENLQWFSGEFNPYGWMIEGLRSSTKSKLIKHT